MIWSKKPFTLLIIVLLITSLFSACGTAPSAEKKIQVAVFYDAAINRQQEAYFDAIANAIIAAQKMHPGKLEVDHIRIPINDNSRDNFIETQLAEYAYDLVIDTDLNYTNSAERIAEKHPNVSFVIVDPGSAAKFSNKSNVTWLVFDEAQQGFVAGAMAALKKSGNIVHLDLCADDVNPSFSQGVQTGIKAVNNGSTYAKALIAPDMQTRKDLPGNDLYDRTFEKASQLYKGGCNTIISDWEVDQLAALTAARENKKWLVATDISLRQVANVASSGSLAGSVEKNYRLAITDTITAKVNGTLHGGDIMYNLSNDGIIYHDQQIQDPAYNVLVNELDKYVFKLKNGEYKI